MGKTIRIGGIRQRIHFLRRHPVWRSQYTAFVKAVSRLNIPMESKGLSVSCGDGTWDFLVLASNHNLKSIIATDVVDCPVAEEDMALLNSGSSRAFRKVAPDRALPLADNSFTGPRPTPG